MRAQVGLCVRAVAVAVLAVVGLGGALDRSAAQAASAPAATTASSPASGPATRAAGGVTGIGSMFNARASRAKAVAAMTDIANLATCLQMFEVDCGRYPTTAEGLGALLAQPANATGWKGPYLAGSALPKDPWGNPYMYVCPGKHNPDGLDLCSFGPDGKEGGGDDIDNWSEK